MRIGLVVIESEIQDLNIEIERLSHDTFWARFHGYGYMIFSDENRWRKVRLLISLRDTLVKFLEDEKQLPIKDDGVAIISRQGVI